MRIEGWNGEIGGVRWWAKALSFSAVVGLLLGLLGPFGSYLNGSLLVLALHWTAMTTLGAVLMGLTVPPLVGIGARHGLPLLFALAIAIIAMAVPLAGLSALQARWLWPSQTTNLGPADWYAQTLAISAGVIVLWLIVERAWGSARMSTDPAGPSDVVPTTAVSPSQPLCLQMEDHYVRVHRASGSTLELMPLQDAIALHAADGIQVHRSWWVATGAVAAAERDGRNWRLRLSNGLVVPVARNRVVEARAKGMIGEDASTVTSA